MKLMGRLLVFLMSPVGLVGLLITLIALLFLVEWRLGLSVLIFAALIGSGLWWAASNE